MEPTIAAAEAVTAAVSTASWSISSIFQRFGEPVALIAILAGIYHYCLMLVNSRHLTRTLRKVQKAYQQEKSNRIEIKKELAKARKITTEYGLMFFSHDQLPRYPLCPVCYADGKSIRMAQSIQNKDGNAEHGFVCPKCKCKLWPNQSEFESMRKQGHLISPQRSSTPEPSGE